MAVQTPPGATATWFRGQDDIPSLTDSIFVRARQVHPSGATAKACLMAVGIPLTQAVNMTVHWHSTLCCKFP